MDTPVEQATVVSKSPVTDSEDHPSKEHAEQGLKPRPLKIYPKTQLLALYKSPLVSLPDGMPELKEWFGTENEQNLNKSEPSTPNGGQRRFRHNADDGDLPSRPSFRSTASQPSQMGNFKHQSMRSNDRDFDKDREGLRNLSDKYDRTLGLRNKDRDIAHFAAGSSRTVSQGTIAARRAEARENTRRKVGENTDDWRRGGDPRRSERTDGGRGERDGRDRPGSHVRDSSRGRRETSPTSRRDREETRKERERGKEDYRRDRDELGRERELERDEDEDPRRWRDDGKRDERMTARRERERGRDRPNENSWETGERRWNDDRDVRGKKGSVKDRKSTATDDTKDREDRRQDRDKEKEPAWMDTYIPSTPGGGILGGKGSDGELDGIQAWKKDMKEKEQKAQKTVKPSAAVESSIPAPVKATESPEEHLDEIQRFKKMMEMAQKNKTPQSDTVVIATASGTSKAPSAAETSEGGKLHESGVTSRVDAPIASDPSRALLSLLTSPDNSSAPSPNDALSSLGTKALSRPPADTAPFSSDRLSDNMSPTSGHISPPPQGSRLLALGNRVPPKAPVSSLPNGTSLPSVPSTIKPSPSPLSSLLVSPQPESSQGLAKVPPRSAGFSPFEEQENLRRASGDRTSLFSENGAWPESSSPHDHSSLGHATGKGSRFAKFFDAKGKEGVPQPPNVPKVTSPVGYAGSTSPIPGQRAENGLGNFSGANAEHRTVEDLFAKLNMNNQLQRPNLPPHASPGNLPFSQNQQQSHNNLLQLQQQLQSQNIPLHANHSRLEPYAESRNFTPDNLVPGLRSVAPPRRENGGMYSDPLDEAVLLNAQSRLQIQQQQRGFDQIYPGGNLPAGFGQQGGRNVGISLQQQQFRGGPSPTIPGQHAPVPQQRLPPGLANLGGRPPHDPSQLLGMQGIGAQSLHGGIINPQQQHGFNNFHPQNPNVSFNGPQPQLRGPPPNNGHALQNHHQLAGGLGHTGGLDLRNANQAQLLALNGLAGGGMRGVGGGGFNPVSSNQLQNPLLAQMRQQQHQQPPPQLPPHMMPQMIPPHLQQGPPMPTNQNAQDLMALLMGGHHRE